MGRLSVSRRTAAYAAEAATLGLGALWQRRALRSARGGTLFRRRMVGLAAIWTAGAVAVEAASNVGRTRTARPYDVLVRPALTAAAAVGVCATGAFVGARIPFVRHQIADVMDHARKGPVLPVAGLALLTGAAEELFFRGASYDLVAEAKLHPVAATTALHVAVTATIGNPVLVVASGLLSTLAGWERARTGSVLAPVVVHVVWSSGMLVALPPIVSHAEP